MIRVRSLAAELKPPRAMQALSDLDAQVNSFIKEKGREERALGPGHLHRRRRRHHRQHPGAGLRSRIAAGPVTGDTACPIVLRTVSPFNVASLAGTAPGRTSEEPRR